jgi:hypothetical protein
LIKVKPTITKTLFYSGLATATLGMVRSVKMD